MFTAIRSSMEVYKSIQLPILIYLSWKAAFTEKQKLFDRYYLWKHFNINL